MSETLPPFHLAIPVKNLSASRKFYTEILPCKEGRSDVHWVALDFFGHQVVLHEVPGDLTATIHHNEVDSHAVPVPHFGVVLPWDRFFDLVESLRQKDITFVIEPYIRFQGLPGEQATMFFYDPSGNALEFKAFRDPRQLFAR